MITRIALLISADELYWWQSLALLAIALFIGIKVANDLFRNESWYHLITSESEVSMTSRGQMSHNGFERYLATIFFTTLFVWIILIRCAVYFLGFFQEID